MQKGFVQQVQMQFGFLLAQPVGVLSAGLLLTGTTIALSSPAAQAALLDWQYDPNAAVLSVNLPPGSTPRYFLAAQPARIVVDLPNTDVGTVLTEKQFPGAVQQIRVAQFQPGVARIVMQLAPGTVLAPQQVDLQQNGDRWVLRPVLAADSSAPTANPTLASAAAPTADPAVASTANPIADPITTPTVVIAPADLPSPQPTDPNLPPLEPGATEIPVELPPAEAAAAAPPTVSVPALSAPTLPAAAPAPRPAPIPPSPALAQEIATASVPSENAAPAAPAIQTPEIQAPELQAPQIQANQQSEDGRPPAEVMTADRPQELSPAEPANLPAELPPATIAASTAPTVNVPALDSVGASPAPTGVNVPALNSPGASSAPTSEAIEFGQPLPGGSSANESVRTPSGGTVREESAESRRETNRRETTIAANSAPGILLPSGTVLNLRYAGEETLSLANDYPLQEVLVVDRNVTDQTGQVIVPEGSQVIGRFETGSSGSEFIAQAISINGQNFLLNGRSDKLSGGRQVPRNQLVQNSAIGAVAGTLLGAVTGVGLIAGIAAGAATSAATTYLTAPQPAVIEPDRVIEVRLLEDLRQPGYGIGG